MQSILMNLMIKKKKKQEKISNSNNFKIKENKIQNSMKKKNEKLRGTRYPQKYHKFQ